VLIVWVGEKTEIFCNVTFGTWVKKGTYGENNIVVFEDICLRPEYFIEALGIWRIFTPSILLKGDGVR